MSIRFTVFGKPQALKRHRSFRRGNFTGQYDPSKGDKADFLAKAMEHKPDKPMEGALLLKIAAYFKRPASHFGRRDKMPYLKDGSPKFHTNTPDADNIAKFIGDALNGIFWDDDKQIAVLEMTKLYCEDGCTPNINIFIMQLEG